MNSINSISKLLRQTVRPNNPISKTTQRTFGSGGQPQPQSMQARLWEGHNTQPEGWETTVYATYAASAVLITLALGFAPDTTITTWASNEARVRMEMKDGGTLEKDGVVFGEHYNTPVKVFGSAWDLFMVKAMNPEEDDDDDDDDDEEEEEEEEEEENDEE